MTNKNLEICKTKYPHSTMLSIFNSETNECLFDVMSHEVGGIKEARKLIKKKLKELSK